MILMKKLFIAANWKMNFTVVQAVRYLQKFREIVQHANATVVLCAPFTVLSALRYELKKGENSLAVQLQQPIFLGAQNTSHQEAGAFTGEISALMVKELASYVVIGHSERRQLFHETDEIIHKKIAAAHAVGLVPILCVGTFVGKKEGIVSSFVEKDLQQQLQNCLTGISFDQKQRLIIAYEPTAAIGSGNAYDPQRTNHICYFIRRQLDQMFGAAIALETKLLYGGSVTSKNAKEYFQQKEIDGLLVGSSSLDVEEFARIVKSC